MRWPTSLGGAHTAPAAPESHFLPESGRRPWSAGAAPDGRPASPGLGEALARIREAAASDAPEDELRDEVVREVAAALRLPFSAVLELDATGRWMTVVAGVGWAPDVVGSGHIPVGPTTPAGLTLRLETPVVCDDLPRAPFLRDAIILRGHGVVSSVSALIGHPDTPVGVLAAYARTRREFTPAETRFVARAAATLAAGLRRRRADAGTLAPQHMR